MIKLPNIFSALSDWSTWLWLMAVVFVAGIAGLSISLQAYIIIPVLAIPFALIIGIAAAQNSLIKGQLFFLGTLTVTSLVLWPRYAYMRFGGLPGITPPRVFLALWVAAWIVAFVKYSGTQRDVSRWLSASSGMGISLGILLIFRCLSVIFSTEPLSMVYVLANDMVFLGVIFALCSQYLTDRTDVYRVCKIISILAAVAGIIAIVEFVLQRNLFVGILPVTDDYAFSSVADKVRDSGYRAQGTFDHPLTLAQFLVCTIPIIVVQIVSSVGFWHRVFYTSAFMFAVAGLVCTRTRSSIAILIFTLLLLFVAIIYRKILAKRVSLGGVLIGIGAFLLICLAATVLSDTIIGLLEGRTSAESSSTVARLIMLQRALPLVAASPLIGYGAGLGAELAGIPAGGGRMTVDSLLISYVVESGVPALLAYVACIFAAARQTIKGIKEDTSSSLVPIGVGVAILAFFATSVTLSLTGNYFLLAVLLGACVGLSNKRVD